MPVKFFSYKYKLTVVSVLFILFVSCYSAFAYVMPAEQILDYMINNFKGTRTVTIVQSAVRTSYGIEDSYDEQVWLESPDKYSVKTLDPVFGNNGIAQVPLYRQLFMVSSRENMESILLSFGIDLSQTSLTRLNGVIAYQIGGKEPGSPKLIIEKERFLPLLFIYKIPEGFDSEPVTVKFEDYQKKSKNWYPCLITFEKGDNLTEQYTLKTYQKNIPIDSSILSKFPEYELPAVSEEDEFPAVPWGALPEDGEEMQDNPDVFEE